MSEACVDETPWAAGHRYAFTLPPRTQAEARVARGLHVAPGDRPVLAHPGRQRAAASLARAWQMLIRQRAADALRIAQRVEAQLGPSPACSTVTLRGEVAAVRAVALLLQDDAGAALAAALCALRLNTAIPVALMVCRGAYWRLGDAESFHAVERREPDACLPDRLRAVSTTFELAIDAAMELDQMHLSSACVLAEEALVLANRCATGTAPIDALPACVLAQVLYEQGRLDESEALLAARLAGIREGGSLEGALRAYGLLARIAVQRRQPGQALLLLAQADALGAKRNWPRLRAASLAQQVEILVAARRIDEAARSAQRLAALDGQCGAAGGSARFEIARYHVLARARLALAQNPAALDLVALRQLHCATALRGDHYGAATIALLLIEALLAAGLREEARDALVALLETAASAGLQQTLVECHDCIAKLIGTLGRGDAREWLAYACALMARRRRHTADAEPGHDVVQYATRSVAAMGLSERERAIIGLMGHGLTNKQIALRLCIAPETVKSHAKHLYAKLSVANRIEAVTLASQLGLVRFTGS